MTQAPSGAELREPTLDDVIAARGRLLGVVRRTPLWPLAIETPGGHPVFVKPESLQAVGSFKIRGALNFLSSMEPEVRERGVVAQSSGNHAQGGAAAARHFGVKATIVIPDGAPQLKVDNTRALGAEVVRCANTQDARESTAQEIADRTGATLVPPYDHPWIVAGQGTVGAEIVEDLPDVANVIAPIGGGGLVSGVALAVRSLSEGAQVIGVEPELAADAHDSLQKGAPQKWTAEQVTRTLADGVRTQCIGQLNFDLMQRLLAGVVRVDEESLVRNVAWYATKAKLVVEPTGTLSLSAFQRLLAEGQVEGIELKAGPTVLVVSGGNIDPRLLTELLTRVAAGASGDYPGVQ